MTDETIITSNKPINEINHKRMSFAKWAEFSDNWRIVPRLLVGGYALLTWKVIEWYMSIPQTLEICNVVNETQLCEVIQAGPTTQHTVLVTTVVGAAAVVFGFYTKSGKDWSIPVVPWTK